MCKTIEKLKFRGFWRSYQKRVLDELNYHLSDDKLNVVAAPGAGKTTLGIEVLTRLKHPSLILVPTITIKNQWKQRIIDNFLDNEPNKDFISDDIDNIGLITISTYQNIHSLYKEPKRKENFFNNLKEKGVKTLVLDEAHHLRAQWYSTLYNLCENLQDKDFKVVSLTGTPPYDVSVSEWNNYNSLCGPVDAEISIPELVKAGDLCPHQDLVYFSNLTDEEKEIIIDLDTRRQKFFEFINKESNFLYILESSSFIDDLDNNIELIYQNTDFTISLISYLLSTNPLHIKARYIAEFLKITPENFLDFDYKKAQTLFNGIFGEFKKHFKNTISIKNKLKELNLLNGSKVDFEGKIDFKKLHAKSKSKLEAIKEITQFEFKNTKQLLREVILLDYIGTKDSTGLNILSVFEKLHPLKINLGILTGTLVVVPACAKAALYEVLEEKNINPKNVLTTEFKKDYLRIETYGNVDIVSTITKLFEKGNINVIIGTAALLGEGWDSPSINTLIIASTVGSFMLSNQMRGRALRIDKSNPDKTSNIWHLVSLDEDFKDSYDIITIDKRFKTFEGISYNKTNRIQNGLERLGLELDSTPDCDSLNQKCFNYAQDRNNLKNKWEQIFKQSKITEKNLAPIIYDVVETDKKQTALTTSIPSWCSFAQNLIDISSVYNKPKRKNIFNKLILKTAHKLGWINEDYKSILDENYKIFVEQTMFENFAKCLLKTLCDLAVIKTDYKKLILRAEKQPQNNFYMTLIGCTNYERNIFIKTFEEIFKIDDNYRYILKQGDKYLGVPNIIGSKAKNVKLFLKYLEHELGLFEAIFTRNPKGYKELLQAKYNTLKTSKISNTRIWI